MLFKIRNYKMKFLSLTNENDYDGKLRYDIISSRGRNDGN